jgi:hypothetical protein
MEFGDMKNIRQHLHLDMDYNTVGEWVVWNGSLLVSYIIM